MTFYNRKKKKTDELSHSHRMMLRTHFKLRALERYGVVITSAMYKRAIACVTNREVGNGVTSVYVGKRTNYRSELLITFLEINLKMRVIYDKRHKEFRTALPIDPWKEQKYEQIWQRASVLRRVRGRQIADYQSEHIGHTKLTNSRNRLPEGIFRNFRVQVFSGQKHTPNPYRKN